MKEFIKRTTTAFFLVLFAYFSIKYLSDPIFSVLLFIIIAVSVYEFIRLTEPNVLSKFLIYMNGLLVAVSFTFKIISNYPTYISFSLLQVFVYQKNQNQNLKISV